VIYIQLAGRLGNQLFQWATALNVQKAHGPVTLVFDDYHQSSPSPLLNELAQGQIAIRKRNLIGRLLQLEDRFFIRSPMLKNIIKTEVDPYSIFSTLPSRVRVVRGFYQNWQNVSRSNAAITEKLDQAIERQLQKSKKIQRIHEELGSFSAIHIRQGDHGNSIFGLLSPEFYKINQTKSSGPVVVFTDRDDLPNKFKLATNPDFIFSPNNLSAEDSFALMSRAKELMIANSTFSWWAGFIALQNGSKVVIPNPWMKDGTAGTALNYPGMAQANSQFV
jgi:hypothetical protein